MEEKNVSAGAIARSLMLALALLNQCLILAGISPIPLLEGELEKWVATTGTVIASLLAWWKNNSFTGTARSGDVVMRERKKVGA